MSPEAVDRLIEEHMNLPERTLFRMRSRVPANLRDEMLGYAYEGLVQAARRYDDTKGVPFSAWASMSIERKVLDGLRSWVGRLASGPHDCKPFPGDKDDVAVLHADTAGSSDVEETVCHRDALAYLGARILTIFTQTTHGRRRWGLPLQVYVDALLCEERGEKMASVAARYGVTESRISQIRTEARLRLYQEPDLRVLLSA